MYGQRDAPHYLRSLVSDSVPRRLLFLDCSAATGRELGAFVDRWQAGALLSTHWTSKLRVRTDRQSVHTLPSELWRKADTFCHANTRTVLWAYDLAYQIRVSKALIELPALDWRLSKIVLERTAAWAELRNGNRTLLMVDLRSWVTCSFNDVAAALTDPKPLSASSTAGRDFHADRALKRAQIVCHAATELLDWVAGEQLGPFRPTGSGQSYSAYRRRFMDRRLFVHDDTGRLELERRAMWTGRCEAWRHGRLMSGPYTEYDMQAAYCRIAAECDIPEQAVGTMRKPTTERLQKAMMTHAVLAEIEVETATPCIPAALGTRTAWPVGTFQTVVWDPELAVALEQCEHVKCSRAYLYRRGPGLREFATYVLRGLDPNNVSVTPLQRRVLKHWSRCLVGRMGLRFRSWERFGTTTIPDLRLATYTDWEDQTTTDLLTVGYERMILTDMQESTESLPQIPSWIMSECRRRLWYAMTACGLENVVYVDTDSIVVQPNGASDGAGCGDYLRGNAWAIKGTYRTMTVHGPRNIMCESDRRVSGVPLTARQVAPLEFTGQVMRSIKESMRAGELDCVANLPRKWHVNAPDLRRAHLPNGYTEPFRLEQA